MMTISNLNGPTRAQTPTFGGGVASPAIGDPSLLPAPLGGGLGGDGGAAELAILLTQADQADRTHARTIEREADAAAASEDSARVAELRAKADATRDAALVNGALTTAGGLCALGSAWFPKDPGEKCFDWRAGFDGASKTLPSVGTLASAPIKAAADEHDANAVRLEAQARADERRSGAAHEEVQAAAAAMQKVEQYLDNVQQARNASRLTAASYRA